MGTKITSPVDGLRGRTAFGPVAVMFEDGVAEYDGELPEGVRAYLERRGYTITTEGDLEPVKLPGARASRADLEAFAAEHGVDVSAATDKAGVRAALEAWAESLPTAEAGEVKVEGDPFDPSEHEVDEVRDYLDSIDDEDAEAHDAEVRRVIDAEKAGQNRPEVVEYVEGTAGGDDE
jgi:hypothetical protein